MNWWDLVRDAGNAFLLQHGVLAAFVYLAVEESGVPIPVPGDFLMLALGVRAREGLIVLWQVIAAMEAGTLLGSSLLYLMARHGGRGVVERYGPFIGIGPKQLERAERQLQRHGGLAVVLGRLLPGLRIVTAIACGIFRVPYRVFLPATMLGSSIYIVGLHAAWLLRRAGGSRTVCRVAPAGWADRLGRTAAATPGRAGTGPTRPTPSPAAPRPSSRATVTCGDAGGAAGQRRRPADARPDGRCRGRPGLAAA